MNKMHQEIRQKILTYWKENKNIQELWNYLLSEP